MIFLFIFDNPTISVLTFANSSLRLIWSPDPHWTASIFEEIKKDHRDPDETVYGTPESEGEGMVKNRSIAYVCVCDISNCDMKLFQGLDSSLSFLKMMIGVTPAIASTIAEKVPDLISLR
jgi:hypothetical protein